MRWGWFIVGLTATPVATFAIFGATAVAFLIVASAKTGASPVQVVEAGLAAAAATPPGQTMPGCTTCKAVQT